MEALHRLKTIDPPQWLASSPDLSKTARIASQHLFSSLRPFTPKSPFDQLLSDGFDAEQIWQQIDLQSQPLISSLRREVKRFEKNPEEISKIFGEWKVSESEKKILEESKEGLDEESQGFDEVGDEDEDVEEFGEDDEEGESEERDGDGEEKEEGSGGGIEDRFLKIKDLEEYLEEDEAREYGLKTAKNKKKGGDGDIESDDDEDDEEGDEEEEEEDGDEDEDEDDDEVSVDFKLNLDFVDDVSLCQFEN